MAGYSTVEKKLESLSQGDYRKIVIPTNADALAFEKVMRLKVRIAAALWFEHRNHHDKSGEEREDFFTFADRYMQGSNKFYRTSCVEHSLLFCNPDSVSAMLEGCPENVATIKESVEQMLNANLDMNPGDLFSKY